MRIAIATFGSGGDLFPLVPIGNLLIEQGHDVRFVVSRSLGLYTRALGLKSISFGDGRELQVFSDDRLCTTRFRGWSSWKQTLDRYVAPTLEHDVESIGASFKSFDPEIVVTSGFAVAAQVVALEQCRAHASCSIYPQHLSLRHHARSNFPSRLFGALKNRKRAELCEVMADMCVVWGCDERVILLHDRAILGSERADSTGLRRRLPVLGRCPGVARRSRGDARVDD